MRNIIESLNLHDRLRRENLNRYFLQCGLASLVVVILLLVLDAVTQTVLIAALGASTFIAFAVPRSLHSDPRHMIGGYIVGIGAGCLMGLPHAAIDFSEPTVDHAFLIIFGALATGLAMLIMVLTKTVHPPAAALALGLVLNECDFLTLVVILAGVAALSICKRLVLPMLMDLL